jgi:V/A-type H+/Na+-transporting ATPase subunit E
MKGLETSKDKVKKICEILKKETLEPAALEAKEIVSAANKQAEEIVAEALERGKRIVEEALKESEKIKTIFQASLTQAARQSLDSLKETIEKKLFNPILAELVKTASQDSKILAKMIAAIVKAIEKEGLSGDLSAAIASSASVKEVNELLAGTVLQKLKDHSVALGTLGGGVEVKLIQHNITFDLSDVTLRELVAQYIRKDFREYIFKI